MVEKLIHLMDIESTPGIALQAITERLKLVMSSIVHQDQMCGVVGRSIFPT